MTHASADHKQSTHTDLHPVPVSERLNYSTADPQLAAAVLALITQNKTYFEQWMPVPAADYYTLPFQQAALAQSASEKLACRQLKYYFSLREFPDVLIGEITFMNIVMGAFCSCHVGYRIAQAHAGRGLMTEALLAATQYVFSHHGLHRAEANIIPRNQPSLRVAEKAGYVNEGLSPKYLRINGLWEDHYHMVKLNANME